MTFDIITPRHMTITHRYLGYTIVFHGVYRVYDQVGNPGVADSFLRFRYLKQAQRYVDTLQECLLNPAPEPEQTHRLIAYYQNNRDDGPLPALLFPNIALFRPVAGACMHVEYLSRRGGWCYCAKPVKRGSTRCYTHEFLPTVNLSELEAQGRVKLR